MFFFWDAKGHLHQLLGNTPGKEILSADGATLKLGNQKNVWKGVCVYQEQNGYEKFSPVSSLERGFLSILNKVKNNKTYLS